MTPRRIICLSAEAADILCRIGAGQRLVGISAYAKLPARFRNVPRVSGYSAANIKRIIALQPDLVIGYSNVQADIARELISTGVNVLITQQTTLAQIAETILLLGRVVGQEHAALKLAESFRSKFLSPTPPPSKRPRVYFEEWPDPMVVGIAWVSELIERAGGQDIFAELRTMRADGRVVESTEVIRRNPEVIIASWCGKNARLDQIAARPGWGRTVAVACGRLYEIESSKILQPGPSIAAGWLELSRIIRSVPLR